MEEKGRLERLDKLLALHLGISRKEAGSLVRKGHVARNGVPVRRPEEKADPENDVLTVQGTPLRLQKHVYLMMNKPQGVLSASRDPKAKTVVDLLPPELFRRGIFPAGRLDKDTTGLLLLTDDGDFAHKMLAPRSHVWKLYQAKLDGPVGTGEQNLFREGLRLPDLTCLPAELLLPPGEENGSHTVQVRIREGKFHQVKRMFKGVGRTVLELKRLQIGALLLDETLAPGEAKPLSPEEAQLVFQPFPDEKGQF